MSNQKAVEYRTDYLLRITRAFLEIIVAYIILSTFYFQSPTILGWNKWETLVVYSFFQIISSTVFILAGYGIDTLPSEIIWGSLDRFLIQPIDSQFSASVKVSYITNTFRLLFGIIILDIALYNLKLPYSPAQIILTGISLISSLIIYYSLAFGVSILSFWTFSYEQGELMSTITSSTRFPIDFFSKRIRNLMYIIPLVFIATVPAQALMGKSYPLAIISPVIALISSVLIRKLWQLGLRSYQSASS